MKVKQIRVDGYKNLINCKVNLGDFNVLVGPNNSGKSNLLEAIQMLYPICFGDQKTRELIFEGRTPRSYIDSSICHLTEHFGKSMTIGVTFEASEDEQCWIVDYDVTVHCSRDKDDAFLGFLSETLTAKEPGKTGRKICYLERVKKDNKCFLKVKGQSGRRGEYPIAKINPSLQAIETLYPDFEGLPIELSTFVRDIRLIASSSTYALSPVNLRHDLDSEKSMTGYLVSTFDIPKIIDKLKEEGKYYDLFRETLCDILDLEGVDFKAEDYLPPSEKDGQKSKVKRMRYFRLELKGSFASYIDEFSDGTLVVAAALASLFSEKMRGPILYLEEIENCLHPLAVEKFLRFLKSNACRWPVLITTHSSYVLNGVNPEDVNVAVVDETGATHFEKIKETKRLRKLLNSDLMSFGDFLPSNFKDVLRE